MPGRRLDGRAFAGEAVTRGAIAILTDDAAALVLTPEARTRVAVVVDANPHRRLAQLAARFFGRQPRTVAAVTGTNGKTSVVHFTREIWGSGGYPAASVGTLGLITPGGRRPGALTTPDPIALHRDLASLCAQGVEHVAVEASSHGLAQFRLDGLSVAAAAFTNLTRDHLDYHGDMAQYRAAKERLFTDLLSPGRVGNFEPDSGEFSRLAVYAATAAIRCSAMASIGRPDLRLVAHCRRGRGQVLLLDIFGHGVTISMPLPGEFQAMNALAALGLVIATGGSGSRRRLTLSLISPVSRPACNSSPRAGRRGDRRRLCPHSGCASAVLCDVRPHTLVAVDRLVRVRRRPRRRQAAADGTHGGRCGGQGLRDGRQPEERNSSRNQPRDPRAAPEAIEIANRHRAIDVAIADTHPGDLLSSLAKGTKLVRSSAARRTLSMTWRSFAKSPHRVHLPRLGRSADVAALDRPRCCCGDRRLEHHELDRERHIDRHTQPHHGRPVRFVARPQSRRP